MKVRFADIETLRWDPGTGLLPAIVQHATSGAVLMLAYVNRESLRATLDRQRAVFYSRSRQRLWEKGETSGHTLRVIDVRRDCDSDTLLVAALPAGPVCHKQHAERPATTHDPGLPQWWRLLFHVFDGHSHAVGQCRVSQ